MSKIINKKRFNKNGKELTEKQLRAIDRMKAGRRLYLEEKKREKEEKRALLKKIRKKQGK